MSETESRPLLNAGQPFTNDEEFIAEVEQAIRDYLFDPESNRISTRFRAVWLDLDYTPSEVAPALKALQARGVVEKIGNETPGPWRYLDDQPEAWRSGK